MPDDLRLEASEFTGLTSWRWVLKDAGGAFLADHEVRLDPGSEPFEALTDLRHYVSWHANGDDPHAEGARITGDLGAWIAERHGAPGELLLETAAGTRDRVTAAELADLPDTARERVKLVTVAACWSAGPTAAEQRRLLRLPLPSPQTPTQTRHPERIDPSHPSPADSPGALATELVSRLGCAVLAMRYPVDDEFAIALSGKLYDLLET